MPLPRPCLDCGTLTTEGSRCPTHQQQINRERDQARPPRPHYNSAYKKAAKQVRDNARVCWICGKPGDPLDPWQADHVNPRQIHDPLLLPAHRSCNIKRAGKLRREKNK